MVDFKGLLRTALDAWQALGNRWTGSFIITPDKVEFKDVKTEGAQDSADFLAFVREVSGRVSEVQNQNADLLTVAIQKHLNGLELARRAKDTITESTHTMRLLSGVVEDKPVNHLNPDDMRLFLDAVRWWPSNASKDKRYDGLTVAEIVERGKEMNTTRPSVHTENKHKQRLKVLLNELSSTEQVRNVKPLLSVLKEQSTGNEDTGRPFADEELNSIFGPAFMPWAKKYPHRYFGPLLGLLSGARVTEVGQLYVNDIEQVGGIWGIHIAKRYFGQKIKNPKNTRFVPIHSKLVEAGLLEYHSLMEKNRVHDRLFPHLPVGMNAEGEPNGLGYGRQLSRQFGAYTEKIGIEKGVAFHAFRHTLSTRLDRAGKDQLEISRLTGHKVDGTVLSKHYIQVRTLPERQATLEELKFDFLELPKWSDDTKKLLEATLRDRDCFHK